MATSLDVGQGKGSAQLTLNQSEEVANLFLHKGTIAYAVTSRSPLPVVGRDESVGDASRRTNVSIFPFAPKRRYSPNIAVRLGKWLHFLSQKTY